MSGRGFPLYCPYCAEQDLWPHEVTTDDGEVTSPHGSWECRGCRRAFSLTMLGVLRPDGQLRASR